MMIISIHAPVKGATWASRPASVSRCYHFNPRTREGCDPLHMMPISFAIDISIHAPVKGATIFPCRLSHFVKHFNPRTREGCDTLLFHNREISIFNFNPRTREGCDVQRSLLDNYLYDISIHAPVKGATTSDLELTPSDHHFNPRTREGCDIPQRNSRATNSTISIHAPVKGATS